MAAGQQARKRDWTIRDMLDWCAGYLQKHGDPDPRGSAQWLVSHATGLEKIELYLDLDRVLNAGELDFMRDAVRRRAKGEPLQYLTGSAPFRFITVEVAPGVLIPRPETEVLVSTLLDMLPAAPRRVATDSLTADELERLISVQKTVDGTDDARATDGVAAGGEGASAGVDDQEFAPAFIEAPAPGQAPAEDAEEGVAPHASTDAASSASAASTQGVSSAAPASTRSTRATNGRAAAESPTVSAASLQVLEIGTGSGCIACSLASERPDIRVTATDISATAAGLARRNAQRIGVADRVEVVQCDLGAGLPASERGAYDGLISNPPYIPTKVYDRLDTEVHDYEPRIALDGGADGLDFFRRLLPFGLQWLKPDAPFTVELHEDALDEAKRLAEAAGYAQVRIVDDMAGRHRIIAARTPQR